jgi:CelD/BcsL family acetyltransferase involved in cellulose biosynthesis
MRVHEVEVLASFDHPAIGGDAWERWVEASSTRSVFQTRDWNRAWWDSFGRGELMLITGACGGEAVAMAPLFAEVGMGFFVASGGSDYLDFLGDVSPPGLLSDILAAAMARIPGFIGFRFYHVPERSVTTRLLPEAAEDLGLVLFDEGSLQAPAFDLAATGRAAIAKKSLVRHTRYFERHGELVTHHYSDSESILARLPAFFEQHTRRWADTPYPSQFRDNAQRRFYQSLARAADQVNWLRFTEVMWDNRPVALHYGFSYRGSYMWYKPSFDITLARRSPGEVLMRQLIMAAIQEDAAEFDLGLGEEAFKERFATHRRKVVTWGLYTPDALGRDARQASRRTE